MFGSLDDFIRTSSIGEFFVRLQMLRAFAAQLTRKDAAIDGAVGSGKSEARKALANLLHHLWRHYSQVNHTQRARPDRTKHASLFS